MRRVGHAERLVAGKRIDDVRPARQNREGRQCQNGAVRSQLAEQRPPVASEPLIEQFSASGIVRRQGIKRFEEWHDVVPIIVTRRQRLVPVDYIEGRSQNRMMVGMSLRNLTFTGSNIARARLSAQSKT